MSYIRIAHRSYWHIVAFIMAVTFLIIQNDPVLRDTASHWYQDILAGAVEKNLMLGSSSISRMEEDEIQRCGSWLNRGIYGSTIEDLIRYISWTPLSIVPRHVLIYAGENDIVFGRGPLNTIASYRTLIAQLRVKFPTTDFHVIAIKPSPKHLAFWHDFQLVNRSVGAYIQQLSASGIEIYFHEPNWQSDQRSTGILFLDDGVHLSTAGYTLFTEGLLSSCNQM